MPADVEAPDKVLYGLTFRQLAILAITAVILAAVYRLLHHHSRHRCSSSPGSSPAVLTFGVAVGRRDGLPFDVWLLHAVRFARTPRALTTADTSHGPAAWVDRPGEPGAAAGTAAAARHRDRRRRRDHPRRPHRGDRRRDHRQPRPAHRRRAGTP